MVTAMNEICYKKNFLVEVVARIDFAGPAESLKGVVLPDEVQNTIKSRYKIYEPSKKKRQGIEITDQGVSAKSEEFHQWVYHGESREKSITIDQHSVVVSLKQYKQYPDFKLDVIEPIRKIVELEGNIYINRTGLRFVNIFEGLTPTFADMKKYFHPMISTSFDNIFDAEHCSRNFLITEYLHDEAKMRIQSGIYNPDYPAKIKKKDFIVDIDAFVDTPHSVANVDDLFDKLHTLIQGKFELCITDNMRKILNEEQ